MERTTLFADVLLPLPLPGCYTYRVPFELNGSVGIGQRVVVQFGQKKIYTAIILRIHEKPPAGYVPKYILSVLDDQPIVNERQTGFWEWMSDYYMCTMGEVMNAALPSGLKLASETRVVLNPAFSGELSALNERERRVLESLDTRKTLTISEVSRIVDQRKVIPLIHNLIGKEVVLIEEALTQAFHPKTEAFLRLGETYGTEASLEKIFDQLQKKAYRQMEVLMAYLHLARPWSAKPEEVSRKALLKHAGDAAAPLQALVKKGILEEYLVVVSRLDMTRPEMNPGDIRFSPEQEKALGMIRESFQNKEVTLLHGVTSSGKTEIFIRLIDEVIAQGKQVLYLLPEIALTTQIINRLRKYFGNRVGVYHSRYNDNERVETWNGLLNTPADPGTSGHRIQVILGARSAIFLPFSQLGLVIVDEEHDTSFKQFDPSPRYHARDAAVVLARLHGARVLLGSATPSVESYENTRSGKYGLVELFTRFGGMQMPLIEVVDVREEAREKRMKSHFSQTLLNEVEQAVARREQVILFQNRRGFSLRLECDTCHWVPQCVRCDVTLIYHKHNNQLRCHYCGFMTKVPEKCPACQGTAILMKGFGTEKVEEELGLLLPGLRIVRMDLDTTHGKYAHQQIINDFEEGNIDVLVGTQMVTKGLDFENVSVVGILNADNMLSYPDFRAHERSYQLMAQVSGRSGRKYKQGKVIIQTGQPQHPVISYVIANNYAGMFMNQLAERRKFKYPPYYRLIEVTLKHKDAPLLNEAARKLASGMRSAFGDRVLGPEYPLVSRIKGYYLKNLLLKLEKGCDLPAMKDQLRKQVMLVRQDPLYKAVRVSIDVDPV